MARKKHTTHSSKQHPSADKSRSFPTMFFESISTDKTASPREHHSKSQHTNTAQSRTERLAWMWSGVVVVMIVVFFTWIQSINASGVLNFYSLFQKNDLIQESRKSLKYYFEKQNQDRAEMNALASPFPSISQTKTNTELGAEQIKQLKERISTLSATSTTSFPSSSNKK
ncbi:MAG: hypothetical protein UX10_C0002G0017 [Candidatus Magasanikbacteria bacterium GW2011_GWA2_45_39]|uniref:Uncharacterized protein n=1 Tax=Candidatus Magasanikbacteria bacterium GW2011_GWA2_45_39 TaxID=1619041 RepID=A0A0G1PRP2_9BACT|nr:MAG: hypothetical protein UX10_C0002G0017 [Candidatus Magasanikbacteria bacterium GW2011_GWA2_45_39]HBW74275.1 hypothetical protein [Candidatus Magasanikbacteria bacterium]